MIMKTMKDFWTLCLVLAGFSFASCSDDDSSSTSPMTIDKIFLENIDYEVNQDREV